MKTSRFGMRGASANQVCGCAGSGPRSAPLMQCSVFNAA